MNWSSLFSSTMPHVAKAATKPGMWSRMGTGLARGLSSQYDPQNFGSYRSRGDSPALTGGSLLDGSDQDSATMRPYRTLFQPSQDPLDGESGSPDPMEASAQVNRIGRPPMSEAQRYYEESQRIQGENPATKAYREHIAGMPMKEDYKPSGWRRLAAALAGGAIAYNEPERGLEAAMEFRDRPYSEALTNFSTKEKVLGAQAGIEQDDINARMKALQNARAMGLKYDEFELKRLETESQMRNSTTTANAAKTRAEAYAKAQARPGFDTFAQEDGSVLYVNKTDPSIRHVVPAKTVQAGQLDVSRQNAETARGQLGVARGRLADSVQRTNISRDRLKDDQTRPVSSTDQINARSLALEEFLSVPEYAEFIKSDDGPLELLPPPEQGWTESDEDFQARLEAYDALQEDLNSRINGILTRRR